MAASSVHNGAAKAKHLRVLLPFSCDSLRVPDELAGEIGAGEALVVGPSGGKAKVWLVEVGRDGDGAFLGRGWPEFAGACGVGAGWLVVLRHRGRGVLTVKAFDSTCCLRELLGTPPPAVEAATSRKDAPHKPQFIRVLPQDFTEKMLIPSHFVEHYIPKEHLNSHMAILLGPLGKVHRIKVEMDQLGVFFAGGWSQFVAFHGITEADSLLLRYEGNMVFTVKVFGPDGCKRESEHKEIRVQQTSSLPEIEKQQEAPSTSIQKRESKNDWPRSEGQKKPKGSMTSLNKSLLRRNSFYNIGPPSWIKMQINTNTLEKHLSLATDFCYAIGLREPRTITLKPSINSAGSWQVRGFPCKKSSYLLGQGWRRFCQENCLKEGDICTFNVIETTLWHVAITRCKEKMNQFCYQETPSGSGRKRKRKYDSSSSEGQKRPKGSMTSLNKASSKKKCVFEIGPPASIKKEINTSTIESLFLPLSFCEAIGLRNPCTITLKTSMSSTMSWQACVVPYKNCSHLGRSGWRWFCQENGIKVGDACTFNVIETTLWHVVIAHV